MFRKNFKKVIASNPADEFFLKLHYNVTPFCSSRYNDKNSNMLSRIQHSFATALNSKSHLPAYILLILDVDLVDFLQYTRINAASLLGQWVEYLATTIHEMLTTRLKALLLKAQPKNDIEVYWFEPASHMNFSLDAECIRSTLVAVIDSVLKEFDNMKLIKIKEFWNRSDNELVMNNGFMKLGLPTYWRALDASFKFNILKRRDYLIRTSFKQLKSNPGYGQVGPPPSKMKKLELDNLEVTPKWHVSHTNRKFLSNGSKGEDCSDYTSLVMSAKHDEVLSIFNDM